MFQENLASQAFDDGKPPPFIPFNDRRLLAARSPPHVEFQHPEFLKLDHRPLSLTPQINQQLDYKLLKLTSAHLNFLKAKAKTSTAAKPTTFNVTAALVWRCRALSSPETEQNRDRVSTILYVTDLRSRLKNPPLPREYCGNALLVSYASAKCGDIEKWPFSTVVEMVAEGVTRVTDEYVRSAIDWLEINGGMMIPRGDCILSSWVRLGYDRVVFPWGKPLCCSPVVNNLERIFWVFPDIDDDGVNVLVQRPAPEMERFQFHFQNFFAEMRVEWWWWWWLSLFNYLKTLYGCVRK